MARQLLPIGVKTFRKIREDNCYYADKTGYALRLVNRGKYYSLSRPRGFGKSLFADTLKELFAGSRELFEGLDICEHWDWSVRHPVVRLDFSGASAPDRGDLDKHVHAQLDGIETRAGLRPRDPTVTGAVRHQWHALRRQAGKRSAALDHLETRAVLGPRDASARSRFRRLLRALHWQTGKRVVVLVDEYDKPILDALEDPEIARRNRNYLRSLYGVTKACDGHIHFLFITGVSRVSLADTLSGQSILNLLDITLGPRYSAICGFTESDLDEVFAPELQGLDRKRIRNWYHGYSWGGEDKVYNPLSILTLCRTREFKARWLKTAAPTFLVRELVDRCVPTQSLDGMAASSHLLGAFDVDRISIVALLFQTGCLTMVGRERIAGMRLWRLGFPNREVRQSLNRILADVLTGDAQRRARRSRKLRRMLKSGDIDGLERVFHSLFAGIPDRRHGSGEVANREIYYASVCYSYFAGLGARVIVEESSGRGRLDMSVQGWGRVYLVEFEVVRNAGRGAATEQLRARRHADKYRRQDDPVHLVAVEFSTKTKSVSAFRAELA